MCASIQFWCWMMSQCSSGEPHVIASFTFFFKKSVSLLIKERAGKISSTQTWPSGSSSSARTTSEWCGGWDHPTEERRWAIRFRLDGRACFSITHLVLLHVVHTGGEDGAQVSQVNDRQCAEGHIDHVDPEHLQKEETTHTDSFIRFRDTNIKGFPQKEDRERHSLPSYSCVCSLVDISLTLCRRSTPPRASSATLKHKTGAEQ